MAVLPAGVPERATDFLGLKTAGEDASSTLLIDTLPTFPCKSLTPNRCKRGVFSEDSSFTLHEEFIKLAFVSVVIEIAVEIGARLHERNYIPLSAFGANGFVDLEGGRVHGPVGRATVENYIYARGGQLFAREQRRLSEFRDVGQDGHAHTLPELGVGGQFRHGLRENHVGTRGHVGLRALDG